MNTFLFSFLWLVGVSENIQQPKTEMATLVLYREKEFNLGRSKAYAFKIDNKEQILLSPNRYAQLRVMPGRIKIQFENDYFSTGKTLWLTMQPGRTYYVKVAVDVDFMRSTMLMAPVAEQEARQELRRMKPVEIAPSAQKN
jgi:hypothetical protein